MKKARTVLPALCVLPVIALAAVSLLGGKTAGLQRNIGAGEQYTAADIRSAMWAVEWNFRFNFPGCSLLELTYDEEFSAARSGEWAAQYGAEEAIVLTSGFEVGDNGPVTLNPNSTYRNWQWILTRSGGMWKLQDGGYA